MPVALDQELQRYGTRVRLFAQAPVLEGFEHPETVWISPPAGTIEPGPADERMYVVDPIGKCELYGFPNLPPWRGPVRPPVMPGPDGHLDHLPEDSRSFLAAHMYGSVRRVLDIWEGYFGRRIEWQFRRELPRLELVPLVDWDNAHSGYGFVETGLRVADSGEALPFCLSFDVLAHEIGHSIVFSEIGVPVARFRTGEFLAFHEAAADLIALIALLHFDSIVDRLLRRTGGNLYLPNVLNRIGELSETEQIRVASNTVVMSDLADVRLDPSGEWVDESGQERAAHELSQPLTGAIFDILVDLFEDKLVERGAFSPEVDRALRSVGSAEVDIADLEAQTAAAYAQDPGAFHWALEEARDHVGFCLARSFEALVAENFDFDHVAAAMLSADLALSGGRYADLINRNLTARGIVARLPERETVALVAPPRPHGKARLGAYGRLGPIRQVT